MKKAISLFLSVMLCFGFLPLLPVQSNAAGKSLAEIKQLYPQDSTWTGRYDNASQCHGWALMVADMYYGFSSTDAERCRNWIKTSGYSNVKAGDVIRHRSSQGGHTAWVIAVDGENMTLAECNWPGSNVIHWGNRTVTKSYLTNLSSDKTGEEYTLSAPYDMDGDEAQYWLDINGWLDGTSSGDLGSYGTVDVYVNGNLVAGNVNDFYSANGTFSSGSTYEIIAKANSGYTFNNARSGSLSGTLDGNKEVVLDFTTTNLSKPTVDNIYIGAVTNDTFRPCLTLGTNGYVSFVDVAVWSDGNQDDLQWYRCENNGSNTFYYDVRFDGHRTNAKYYTCHFYVTQPNGNRYMADSITYNVNQPTVENTYIGLVTKDTFRVCITLGHDGLFSSVSAAIWSNNNQDDIKWYDCYDNGAYTFFCDVPFADLRDNATYFTCHFYVKQPNGNNYLAATLDYTKDTTPPEISNVKVTAKADGYTVTCKVTDNVGVTEVSFPAWTSYNGQDDIVWYEGTINGNTVTCWIPRSDHNNETGTYYTHIYAYDLMDNGTCYDGIGGIKVGSTTGFDVNFLLDGQLNSNDCSAYGSFDVYINDSLAANDTKDFANQYYYGTTYEIKDIKAKTGHTYAGATGALSGTIGNDGIDLRLKFNTNSSTLTVDPNGGTWGGSAAKQSFKQNYNTSKSIPLPTREGYSFAGWQRTNNYGAMSSLTAAATYTYGATNNVTDTITAKWNCNHNYTSAVTKQPTCKETGVRTYTCSTCNNTYTEQIPMIDHADTDKDGKCDACGLVLIATPEVPVGVTANATGDKAITVSWDAVDGATQYNVYRYNGTAYKYVGTTFADAANPTRFVNTGLTVGTDYYYKVVAVYKDNGLTLQSDKSAFAHTVAVGTPAIPTNVAVTPTAEKQLTVTWSAVKGATQYNVYRYNGTAYKYIGTTFADAAKPTQYVDGSRTVGTDYYYKVVAVCKGSGLTFVSDKSAFAHAVALGTPAIPTNVAINPTAEKELTVSWNAVKGATQYNVYRYNGAAYKYIGTTFADAAQPTQYVDSDLTVGTDYYYKVVSVCKGSGLTFVSDKSAFAHTVALGTPAIPQSVTVTATGPKELTVTWSAVKGATQYNVYRYNGTAYKYIGTTFADAAQPTQYADGGRTAGTDYYYKVVAVCKSSGFTFVSEKSAFAHAVAAD